MKRDKKKKAAAEKESNRPWSLPFQTRRLAQENLLPPQDAEDEGKFCLVLDMDETLLHCSFVEKAEEKYRQTAGENRQTDTSTKPDFHFEVSCFNVEVRCRPNLQHFLKECAKVFEMVIFTASLEEYANKAMDLIDPSNTCKYRLYRPATVTFRGVDYVKDLANLGRDLRRTVLIDNNHLAMLASPDNSIAINDFYGDASDHELDGALKLLMRMKDMDDVRPFLRKAFQMREQVAEILDQYNQEDCYDEDADAYGYEDEGEETAEETAVDKSTMEAQGQLLQMSMESNDSIVNPETNAVKRPLPEMMCQQGPDTASDVQKKGPGANMTASAPQKYRNFSANVQKLEPAVPAVPATLNESASDVEGSFSESPEFVPRHLAVQEEAKEDLTTKTLKSRAAKMSLPHTIFSTPPRTMNLRTLDSRKAAREAREQELSLNPIQVSVGSGQAVEEATTKKTTKNKRLPEILS